jgi:hypothetical protein
LCKQLVARGTDRGQSGADRHGQRWLTPPRGNPAIDLTRLAGGWPGSSTSSQPGDFSFEFFSQGQRRAAASHPDDRRPAAAQAVLRFGSAPRCRTSTAGASISRPARAELPKTLIGKVPRRQLAAEEPGVPMVPLPRAGCARPERSRGDDRVLHERRPAVVPSHESLASCPDGREDLGEVHLELLNLAALATELLDRLIAKRGDRRLARL